MNHPRYFKHYKGNYYRLLHIGYDSESMERMVVYQALYGEGKIWIRPEQMFFEEIEVGGKMLRRFEEVDESEVQYEKTLIIQGVPYCSPSLIQWQPRCINDIPLTPKEYKTLRKGYIASSDMKYAINAYKGNIYIIRSGYWLVKMIFRPQQDGLYHLEEFYHSPKELHLDVECLINDVFIYGEFDNDSVRTAYLKVRNK